MTKQTITTIEFHGATLLATKGETPETTLVAMKPVVEGMGLDWSYQLKKLKDHPLLSQGVAVIAIPSDGGTQDATALPLNRLHFWMATIHSDRIKDEEVRARVIDYQAACADVLFNHFFGQIDAPLEARQPRPFDQFGTEELNARIGAVRQATRLWGRAAGSWAWEAADLPMPPRQLLPAWAQHEMDLRAPQQIVAVPRQIGGSAAQ